MRQKKQIGTDINFVQNLNFVLQAYQQISAMRMNKIRGSVLNTRRFLERVSEVFYEVKTSYEHQIAKMQKKEAEVALVEPKKAAILLSANARLYGTITKEVFEKFYTFVEHNNYDAIIIGNIGLEFYKQMDKPKAYQFFDIPDNLLSIEELQMVIPALLAYDEIIVFHGKFESTVTQRPVTVNISGNAIYSYESKLPLPEKSDYLFEPGLPTAIKFFRNQVVAALFKQTVHESHLARLASRINAMEEGINMARERQKKLYVEQTRARREQENKRQLEKLASISLWA